VSDLFQRPPAPTVVFIQVLIQLSLASLGRGQFSRRQPVEEFGGKIGGQLPLRRRQFVDDFGNEIEGQLPSLQRRFVHGIGGEIEGQLPPVCPQNRWRERRPVAAAAAAVCPL